MLTKILWVWQKGSSYTARLCNGKESEVKRLPPLLIAQLPSGLTSRMGVLSRSDLCSCVLN